MKRTLLVCSFLAAGIEFYSCTTTIHVSSAEPVAAAPAPAGVSYQTFYDELSPYGHWVNDPGYGYVWMPAVDAGFRPYATNGHWVYSEDGWTWVSDYPWGWAAFHYGRWFYDNGYGWMWVPGHEWAPAWVSWRKGNDVYGWAPLSPGADAGNAYSNYDPPANYWCFVPHQYVTSPHVNNYYVAQTNNVTIIKNTTIINNNTTVNNYGSNNTTSINSNNNNNNNNRNNNNSSNNGNNSNNGNYNNSNNNGNNRNNRPAVFSAGPGRNEVEQATNTHIEAVAIRDGNKPGTAQAGNGQLVVYRPRVTPVAANTQNKPVPARIELLKEIKPAPQANNVNIVPVRREPVQNGGQPVQHPGNLPAANTNPGTVTDRPNAPAGQVKTNDSPVTNGGAGTVITKPVAPVTPVNTNHLPETNNNGAVINRPVPAAAPAKTTDAPVVNSNPATVVNKAAPPVLVPVKRDPPAGINQPDKTAARPLTNPAPPVNTPAPAPVRNNPPPVINRTLAPVNNFGKTPGADNPANTPKPGAIKPDINKMNLHRPAPDSLKKTIKPQPPVKTDTDKKNKADGGDTKQGQ